MYIFRGNLVCLSKLVCMRETIEKTLAYCKICPFSINFKSVMFNSKDNKGECYKPFFLVNVRNKLESLSTASLSSLV